MCKQCEAPLVGMSAKAVYCSRTCRDVWARRKRLGQVLDGPVPCGSCGVDVSMRPGGSKFCSTRCKNAFHNAKQDHRLRYYGIAGEDVARLASEHGGCAVCGSVAADWVIDHDHTCCPGRNTCGKCVRGILCRGCNAALGMLGDDPNRMLAAAAYVLSTRDVITLAIT